MESAIEEIKNIFKVHNFCNLFFEATFRSLSTLGHYWTSLASSWKSVQFLAHGHICLVSDLGLFGYFWACFGTFGHNVSKVPKKTMVDQECQKVSKLLQCLKLKNIKSFFGTPCGQRENMICVKISSQFDFYLEIFAERSRPSRRIFLLPPSLAKTKTTQLIQD